MKITESIRPVTYMKTNAARLLKEVNQSQQPVVITQEGVPRAVVLAPESFERLRNAAGLMKLLAQGEREVHLGNLKAQGQVFLRLKRKIESLKNVRVSKI